MDKLLSSDKWQILVQPREIIKLILIVLGLICNGLVRGYVLMGGNPDYFLLSFLTSGAFLIITPVSLLSLLLGERPKKFYFTELLLDILAGVLYVSSGACSFDYYTSYLTATKYKHAGIAFGTISILTGLLYLINAVLLFRDKFPTNVMDRFTFQRNVRV